MHQIFTDSYDLLGALLVTDWSGSWPIAMVNCWEFKEGAFVMLWRGQGSQWGMTKAMTDSSGEREPKCLDPRRAVEEECLLGAWDSAKALANPRQRGGARRMNSQPPPSSFDLHFPSKKPEHTVQFGTFEFQEIQPMAHEPNASAEVGWFHPHRAPARSGAGRSRCRMGLSWQVDSIQPSRRNTEIRDPKPWAGRSWQVRGGVMQATPEFTTDDVLWVQGAMRRDQSVRSGKDSKERTLDWVLGMNMKHWKKLLVKYRQGRLSVLLEEMRASHVWVLNRS